MVLGLLLSLVGLAGLGLSFFALLGAAMGGAWGRPLRVRGRQLHPELREGADDVVTPDLLGLFDGVPLPETGEDGVVLRPNRIFLFQRNLERMAATREELDEQIRVTLYHELGHYLGFEEEDMDDLGLA